jgi:hypothetical protein
MSTKPSLLWSIALPVSLLILAAAYYVKVPSARQFIDAHTSLGHAWLGRFVGGPQVVVAPPPSSASDEHSIPGIDLGTAAKPLAPGTPEPFSLQKLANNPALWPKKITLRKAVTFPAVVNGKVVGDLIAPVGSEANLKAIKDGKIGVEYQGGGAWLNVEDTDLVARVTAN